MASLPRLFKGGRKPPRQATPKSAPEQALDQLGKLLERHRLSVPFPVDPLLFVRSLLPKLDVMVETQEQTENLSKAVNMDMRMYVSVGEPDSSYDSYFWIRVPKPTIAPIVTTDCYILWEKNPHWQAVSQWHQEAMLLAGKMDSVQKGLQGYLDELQTAAEMRICWPELMRFVRLRGPTMAHVSSERRKALDRKLRDFANTKTMAEEMLAAATLLDAEALPVAWVGMGS